MLRKLRDAFVSVAIGVITGMVMMAVPLMASQNSLFNPTSGTLSGLTMVQGFNSAIDSVNTCNSGATAPTNQLSGVPSLGNCWINTATTPNTLNYYDGTNWLPLGYLDTSNHLWIPILGGGNGTPAIASATTTNLCPSTVGATVAPALEITGTTTVTSFGTNCGNGTFKLVMFGGALTLTNSGSLVLLSGANITTAAGDWGIFLYVAGTGWYNVAYQKASGAALSSVGLSIGSSALANSSLGFNAPINLQVNTGVGSSALTISVVGNNGGNASSTNPILVPFRDSTASGGDPVIRSLQAALSFTIFSGNTMGCSNGQMCRLRLYLIDNSGTLGLCAYNSLNGSTLTIVGLSEAAAQTTGSGTGGGSSAQTLYCNIALVSSKSVREIGYVDISESTAGTWTANASVIQLMGPSVHHAGDRSLVAYSSTAAWQGLAGGYSYASSGGVAPTTSNMTQIFAGTAVTPQSPANVFFVQAFVSMGSNSTDNMTSAIFDGSTPVAAEGCSASSVICNMAFDWLTVVPQSGSKTYSLYGGGSQGSASATFLNSNTNAGSGNGALGGASRTSLRVEEIWSSVDRPVNDNVHPGIFAMTG